ncbi:MAG: CPBP family intramembrane metalloprotease [Clostridia bacterium]|nr:CPBP family intramembrane metalloprotease [Clostridia bacterium]
MKEFIRAYWKTLLFFAVIGLVGGYFVGVWQLDSYPAEIREEICAQGFNDVTLGIVTAAQSAGYGLVLGAVGIWLGRKTGLWKDERRITKGPLMAALAVALVGGLALILPDLLLFGRYEPALLEAYAVKPTIPYMLATVFYGGVIEEVMLRLFMMSLVAFVLHRLFERGRETVGTGVLAAANVVAAVLFAVGHLPANDLLFGLTPVIVIRCLLLNGGFGLAFGWLYRKFGLRYAMIAHAGCHVISKAIWMLFI